MDVPTERQHRVIELFCILTLSTSNPVMILQNSFARHCHLKKLVKSTDDLYLISYKCICFYNYLKIKSLNTREKKRNKPINHILFTYWAPAIWWGPVSGTHMKYFIFHKLYKVYAYFLNDFSGTLFLCDTDSLSWDIVCSSLRNIKTIIFLSTVGVFKSFNILMYIINTQKEAITHSFPQISFILKVLLSHDAY